jgi:hypothetical protein
MHLNRGTDSIEWNILLAHLHAVMNSGNFKFQVAHFGPKKLGAYLLTNTCPHVNYMHSVDNTPSCEHPIRVSVEILTIFNTIVVLFYFPDSFFGGGGGDLPLSPKSRPCDLCIWLRVVHTKKQAENWNLKGDGEGQITLWLLNILWVLSVAQLFTRHLYFARLSLPWSFCLAMNF